MGDDRLDDRSVEVLGIPEDVDDDLLWLYFESKRSGGGNVVSLERTGDKALLIFEHIEDVTRVLSKESHTLSNAKLVVRKKPPKDRGKFVLRGLTPNTSLEMVELYVENLTGIDSENYTLYPSARKDLVLIHLHVPLTEDFENISDKVCKRKLDGAKLTLEQVERPDSILVENLSSTLTDDTLLLYFESSRGGGGEVVDVGRVDEGIAKVSFKDPKSVDCVLQTSHRLEDTDLIVKPYFSFLDTEANGSATALQNGSKQQQEQNNRSSLPAQSGSVSDPVSSTTSVPFTTATPKPYPRSTPVTPVTPEPHPRSSPVTPEPNLSSSPVTPKPHPRSTPVTPEQKHNSLPFSSVGSLTTASPTPKSPGTSVAKDSMEEAAPTVFSISVPDQTKLRLISLSNSLDALRKAHPNFEITLKQDGVQIKGPGHLEAERLKGKVLEFLGGFSQHHMPMTELKAKFLEKEAVKDMLLTSLKNQGLPCTYVVSDGILIVTSLSLDMVAQACEWIDSLIVEFKLSVEPDYECMLYCQEWTAFLQSLDTSFAEVTDEGAKITVVTLKNMEEEAKVGIVQFLSTPVQREAVLSLEPAMLRYLQLHQQQLLCDMQQVLIVPLETADGLSIQGNPSACQTAMELLSAVVDSTHTKTITVSQPGISRFLLDQESESIIGEMTSKFQVYISLEKVQWEPLEDQDIFELAWKMTPPQNFQRNSSAKQCTTACIEEAKKILSVIEDDSFKLSDLKTPSDEEEDLYTDATTEQHQEECASLSLAIQMSMDTSQGLDTQAEEELQKVLELSRGEAMLASKDQMLEKAVDLSLQEAIVTANHADIQVFASYPHDLVRVDIALGKKVGMRQCEEKVEHKALRRLSAYYKRCVDLIKRKHAVQIRIQESTATVSGFKDYVSAALSDLNSLLKRVTNTGSDDDVLKTVEWVWQEEGSATAVPYPPEATVYMENAWSMKQKKTDIVFNGQPFIIDFEKMKEYSVSSGKSVTIARRVIGSEGSHSSLQDEDYSLVSDLPDTSRLDESSDEFQNVVKEFYDTIHDYHNKIKIIKVEKLMNTLLYNQYRLKKTSIEQSATHLEVERTLYHGTSETSVKEICIHGFNRSFCGKNATIYGQGVYFAVDSALSLSDTYSPPNVDGHKFIIVAKVLTGDFTVGKHDMKTAPLKEDSGIPVRYHSVADKIVSPTLFVIFNDTQAYPLYLITCQGTHAK
ncbi:protein mono-ADP-ribosyltransferase PARP10 [Brachyhypopomus gauderio]|uniref:protein mono-ADP-ribosyltransferase PARP10 n=1 Tax=Brachyhypopomus gauderio TaxID=698409 RepID=UPI004042BA83